jgi:hypothetical protein
MLLFSALYHTHISVINGVQDEIISGRTGSTKTEKYPVAVPGIESRIDTAFRVRSPCSMILLLLTKFYLH